MIIVKKLYNRTYIYIICEVFDQYFDNIYSSCLCLSISTLNICTNIFRR